MKPTFINSFDWLKHKKNLYSHSDINFFCEQNFTESTYKDISLYYRKVIIVFIGDWKQNICKNLYLKIILSLILKKILSFVF